MAENQKNQVDQYEFDADIKILPPHDTDEDTKAKIAQSVQQIDDFRQSEYSNYTEATKTDKTKADYTLKASRILRKAARELRTPSTGGADLLTCIQHIINQRSQLTRATWRFYKAALIHFLLTEQDTNDEFVQISLSELYTTDTSECKAPFTGSGASRKKKSIPKEDLDKLNEAALAARTYKGQTPLAQHAVDWLIAATVTGLRPIEWREAKIEAFDNPEASHPKRQHRIHFTVKNAKSTNGRAHGSQRRFLVFTDLETRQIIEEVRDRTTTLTEADFAIYLKNCRQALNRLRKKIWPDAKGKGYTLYTGRHQFSANQKASGKSRKEVSYLMGHKVTKTAIMSYGKKRSGWGTLPADSDVEIDEIDFDLKVTDDAKTFKPASQPGSTPSINPGIKK